MRRLITTSLITLGLGGAGTAFAGGPSSFPSALPPVANPGECYAQVKIPAQYSTGTQTIMTAEGFTKLDVTEPEFRRRTETVMTKEPSTRFVVRQPSYRSVSEQILTRPGHDRLSVSAPQFSTVTETVQTSAPHLVWKRGNPGDLRRQGYVIHSTADGRLRAPAGSGGYQGGSYANTQSGGDSCGPGCEIWCLVEEPGTSVTTSRRALTAPPRVTRTPVPPQYKTIVKQVVSDPGGVQEIPVPAEYASVSVEDLVRPAEAYEVNVPPVMGQVETKNLVSPERYEWRRVLCQPGTGTIRSGSSYQTEDHQTSYSSGTSYSHGSSTTSQYTGSTPHTQQPSSGYYGTEGYPAYQRRGPNRKRH
ncbi:MAG: hypothetical protein ABJO36_06335 [Litorimonas sp.]